MRNTRRSTEMAGSMLLVVGVPLLLLALVNLWQGSWLGAGCFGWLAWVVLRR